MKPKRISLGTVGPLAAFAVLAAFLAGLASSGCGEKPPPPKPAPQEVVTVTIEPRPILLVTELPGFTSPYLIAEIRPQVAGIVEKRLFEEGSNVKAGDVLYQIERARFQAVFDNANASLARSEANLPAIRLRVQRYSELLADKAVSQQDYDDADAALKQAEADTVFWKATVDTARINLDYTRVTAPISGRIGRSTVTDGALVAAHQLTPMATIQQTDPIYVDVPQSTADLLRLRRRFKEGSLDREGTRLEEVAIILEDGTPYESPGTLQFQDITVVPTTASVILRVVVPNPREVLLPGMFVRAVVKEGVNKEAILVPQQCVSRNPKGNPIVLLVNVEGKVEQREIVIERAIGSEWLVSSGLAPGERVIVEGMRARPGDPVKVVPPEAPAETPPEKVPEPSPDASPGSSPDTPKPN
jgi:membrane fusion protein (multidrug efflux system)